MCRHTESSTCIKHHLSRSNHVPFPIWSPWNLNLTSVKGKIWVPLGRCPSSCSQHITPYCPIQPLYNPYIGGIGWYISRVLSQGYPTFPFESVADNYQTYLIAFTNHGEPTTFILRGYNPYLEGLKPSFFMDFGVHKEGNMSAKWADFDTCHAHELPGKNGHDQTGGLGCSYQWRQHCGLWQYQKNKYHESYYHPMMGKIQVVCREITNLSWWFWRIFLHKRISCRGTQMTLVLFGV